MKCERCRVEMRRRTATRQNPYAYVLSGLENVHLTGITIYSCDGCRDDSPIIPRVGQLHRAIAAELVRKPTLLSGAELRFLRKNVGFPGKKFAALLGDNPAYLSRIENGHTKNFGAAADRLARALVVAAGGGDDVRDMLLKMADDLGTTRASRKPQPCPVFKLVNRGWRLAA